MGMMRFLGIYFLVPTAILFTLSYFVIIVNSKQQIKRIRRLGYFVVVLLWLAALAAAGTGVYLIIRNNSLSKCPIFRNRMYKGMMGAPRAMSGDMK